MVPIEFVMLASEGLLTYVIFVFLSSLFIMKKPFVRTVSSRLVGGATGVLIEFIFFFIAKFCG
jgi:hypothetical protein